MSQPRAAESKGHSKRWQEQISLEILFLLIPLGLVILGVAIWGFLWAVRSGQFDDLEGPAHRILMDDDDPRIPTASRQPGEDEPEAKPDRADNQE